MRGAYASPDLTAGGIVVDKTNTPERERIGGNGGPPLFTKKRWAISLFGTPDKPAGAVAMAFKLYMEMNGDGRGATISDAEFQVACGVSDGSVRNFKRWLISHGFIQIARRGARGHRSEFLATLPAADAAIENGLPATNAGMEDEEYRQPLPARADNLPATAAANPELPAPPAADPKEGLPHTPSKENTKNNNNSNKLASEESGVTPLAGLSGLNGSTEPMIRDIVGWMPGGGDEASARLWLAKFVSIHGQDVVRDSYLKLNTDLLTGSIIPLPLGAWGKIANRLRTERRSGKPSQQGEPTKGQRRRLMLDEIEKKLEAEKTEKASRRRQV